MADIYTRLAAAGFDRKFVIRAALPHGWYDSRGNRAVGRALAEESIADSFGISLEALQESDDELGLTEMGRVGRLHPPDSDLTPLVPAVILARRIATLTVEALPRRSAAWLRELNAEKLRSYVLAQHNIVRLQSVVETCWGLGVPVVYLSHLPARAARARFDSMSLTVGDTPVILLSGQSVAPAWLLWHLAHQIAHVCGDGHSKGDIIDVDLLSEQTDESEDAAQTFADHLVCGPDPQLLEGPDRITGVKLASLARKASRDLGLDSGALVVRFAIGKAATGRDARGPVTRALRELGIESGGDGAIADILDKSVDFGRLSEPQARFLRYVAGL